MLLDFLDTTAKDRFERRGIVAKLVPAYLLGLLQLVAACGAGEGTSQRTVANCRPYDPATAKRAFDGRVGSIIFRNASGERVHVDVYHPDGQGSVEVSWTVPAGAVADLGAGFGSDWGIRAGAGCTTTLGQAGRWSEGRFVIDWRESTLTPGESPKTNPAPLKPNEI